MDEDEALGQLDSTVCVCVCVAESKGKSIQLIIFRSKGLILTQQTKNIAILTFGFFYNIFTINIQLTLD